VHGFTVCCKEALEGDGAQKTDGIYQSWMMARVAGAKE
jgi:hypothetical protein